MSFRLTVSGVFVYGLIFLEGIQAQSAYTPPEKTTTITPTYTYQSFNKFKNSRDTVKLRNFGIEAIQQHSVTVSAEYGITNEIAADVSLGYVSAYTNGVLVPGDPKKVDGLNDTLIGIRWKFLDESKHDSLWVPTLTARVGGIIAGTYEEGFINSPGDGAFGMEYSLLLGRYYEKIGFGYYGNATHRVRGNVPDEFFGQFGIYKFLYKGLSANFGYRRLQSLSGINFDSAEFRLDRFQDLNEISDTIEYGLSYTDGGGRSYNVGCSNLIDGKNVGLSFTLNLSASFSF